MTEEFPLTNIKPITTPKPLTKTCMLRYERILKFIDSSIRLRGQAPTVREIQKFMGYRSPASAVAHLQNMLGYGLIVRTGDTRGSRLTLPQYEGLTDLQRHALLAMKAKGVTLYEICKEWSTL